MDAERVARVRNALEAARLDALVCAMPAHVRMLSGYWPVTGASIALFTREGAVALVVPEDECEFARQGWADPIVTYSPASLGNLRGLGDILPEPLQTVCRAAGLTENSSIGIESGAEFDPSTYASNLNWGGLLESLLPQLKKTDATPLMVDLKAVLTGPELDGLRRACSIAACAFRDVNSAVQPGAREYEAAALLRSRLNRGLIDGRRSGGFAWCMSGPNAALAYRAYQLTGDREFEAGDHVLLHCNSYYAGMWTDVTRTVSLDRSKNEDIRAAISDARSAAISAVRPGVEAREVDHAAREVLEHRGFGKQFRHATGHGVGFAAINHNAKPRIHPLSHDLLESGMVFNIEPAVYIEGVCGMRHCDMVAVTPGGAELLTRFP